MWTFCAISNPKISIIICKTKPLRTLLQICSRWLWWKSNGIYSEVFDHCHSSWMLAESMNNSRGYFGIVVSGDAIYVLGGRQNDGRVLEHSKQPFVKMFLRNLWIVKRSFWCPFAASLPLSCEAWGSSWTAQNLIMPTL